MPLDWQVIVTQVVEEMFTAAAIVAAVAFVGKSAVESFFRSKVDAVVEQLKHKNSQELERVKFQFLLALQQEKASADLQTFRTQQILESERDFQTRIRTEILAWANPILNSVRDLRWRLINILNKGAYPALDDGLAARGVTGVFRWRPERKTPRDSFGLFQKPAAPPMFSGATGVASPALGHL